MSYLLHIGIIVLLYASFVLSFAVAIGFTGLINLGHIALVGVGAYTASLLMTKLHLSFWLAVLAGGGVSSLCGFLLALPTKKIKGDYFALLTLGFSFIVYAVLLNWTSVTDGALGVAGIPRPPGFERNGEFVWLMIFFVGALYLICQRIVTSPFGRVMQAVRDDEVASEVLGKPSWRINIMVMTLTSFLAGMAGSFFASFVQFIDPTSFALPEMVLLLSMILIGGLGYLPAALIGVLATQVIFEPLRFLPLPAEALGPLRQILYSLVLILVILFRPKGILGKVELE